MSRILHAVYRADGEIVSASESENFIRPAQMHGLKVGKFEVPAKFASKKKIHEFVPFLVIDVAARRLKER